MPRSGEERKLSLMLAYDKKEECAGCTACMNICPQFAITMEVDQEGFLYPVTNEELCNECGLCQQICPFHNVKKVSGNFEQPRVYAAKHRDDNVRMNSSSGGMFTALSDYILLKGGIIYGAVFDEQHRVCHQKAETEHERNKFRGSKYVQSDLGGVFADIKNELKRGRKVLFTGTPCQNAGLHAFLNYDFDNLYLCDNVCHGTPSPLIFKDYIKYCENKNRSRITAYYCRYKGNGWHSHTEKSVYENGTEDYTSLLSQSYKNLFYSHMILRPACHNCKFCNFSRPSDITIADFWGVEKSMLDFDDNMGVSLVLVNSPKGEALLENIKEQIVMRGSNMQDCLQHNLQVPSEVSSQREQFWQEYRDKGFEYVLKKYAGYGAKASIKRIARNGLDKTGLLPIARRLVRK